MCSLFRTFSGYIINYDYIYNVHLSYTNVQCQFNQQYSFPINHYSYLYILRVIINKEGGSVMIDVALDTVCVLGMAFQGEYLLWHHDQFSFTYKDM